MLWMCATEWRKSVKIGKAGITHTQFSDVVRCGLLSAMNRNRPQCTVEALQYFSNVKKYQLSSRNRYTVPLQEIRNIFVLCTTDSYWTYCIWFAVNRNSTAAVRYVGQIGLALRNHTYAVQQYSSWWIKFWQFRTDCLHLSYTMNCNWSALILPTFKLQRTVSPNRVCVIPAKLFLPFLGYNVSQKLLKLAYGSTLSNGTLSWTNLYEASKWRTNV